MGDFRSDDYLRRLIRDMQRIDLNVLQSQIAPLTRQLHDLQKSAVTRQLYDLQKSLVGEGVMRSIRELQSSLVPKAPDLVRTINEINKGWTREIAADLARAGKRLRERALPANWSEFSYEETESILALMDETGWSLVWVPRAEIIRKLLDADPENREQVLVDSADDIITDLDAALAEISHTQLVELREALAQAIGAFRAGFSGPAQSYATAVFTTTMHVPLGLKEFKDARDEFEKREPMKVGFLVFKIAAIYRTAARAIANYWGDEEEPIPTAFNRHASTHRVSGLQYTRVNALAALLLATSLLRELDPLFKEQFPENGSARGT